MAIAQVTIAFDPERSVWAPFVVSYDGFDRHLELFFETSSDAVACVARMGSWLTCETTALGLAEELA